MLTLVECIEEVFTAKIYNLELSTDRILLKYRSNSSIAVAIVLRYDLSNDNYILIYKRTP